MENITLLNCPVVCVMIRGSNNLTINNWFLNVLEGDEVSYQQIFVFSEKWFQGVAPEGKFAHNTDGFTMANTNNLLLENTKVYNQDDCVAITSGK